MPRASSGGAVGICNSAATSPGPCCKRWSNAGVACKASATKMADESIDIMGPILVGFLRSEGNWGTPRIPAGKIEEP